MRNCQTCKLTRPAKGSHCNICGHCVHGFDHHCAALNNCVGRRTIRSFVSFLLFSSAFASLLTANCLILIFIDFEYTGSTDI